jgi:hypothetical protein
MSAEAIEVEVHVLPDTPGEFRVACRANGTTTQHTVAVPERVLDDIGLPRLDPFRLVEESFAFLLEREPNTSIMASFALSDIGRFFPEYVDEMRSRLS